MLATEFGGSVTLGEPVKFEGFGVSDVGELVGVVLGVVVPEVELDAVLLVVLLTELVEAGVAAGQVDLTVEMKGEVIFPNAASGN